MSESKRERCSVCEILCAGKGECGCKCHSEPAAQPEPPTCNAQMAIIAGGGALLCNAPKGHIGRCSHTFPFNPVPAPAPVPQPRVDSMSVTFKGTDPADEYDPPKCDLCNGYHIGGCTKNAPAVASEAQSAEQSVVELTDSIITDFGRAIPGEARWPLHVGKTQGRIETFLASQTAALRAENERLRQLANLTITKRTAWLEAYGVPISQEFAEFAEALGTLIQAALAEKAGQK